MNCRVAVLVFLMLSLAFVRAADEPKKPILLLSRDAKISSNLTRYSSTGTGGVSIGGLVDKTGFIDFELNVEPGKYRLNVSLRPLGGGGYLLAKVGDGPTVRRSVPKGVYSDKPQEFRFTEIEIPKDATKLRFSGENISQPGIGYFNHAELIWVASLPALSKAKSPLQLAAEKEKALKEAEAAKQAQELRDNLKGTTWSFCYNHNFEEYRTTLVFDIDGNLGFSGSPGRSYKVVDSRTIDIIYSSSSGMAFSRLRFADDMGSFKSNLEEGIRQPRSGRLLKVLGATGDRPAQPGETQVKSPTEMQAEKEKLTNATPAALREALVASIKGTSWSWYGSGDFSGKAYTMSFNANGTMSLPWDKNSRIKVVDGKTIDVFYGQKDFWRLQFSDDFKSFKSDLSVGMREPKSGRRK